MKNQILRKKFTLNYLFVFIGTIVLLTYTNPCSAQEKPNSESYKTYIKLADKAFAAMEFEKALELYKKANQAKPEYNYPSDKIDEIKKILKDNTSLKTPSSSQTQNSNASYKALIAKADYAYDNKDYAAALLFYEKAFQTKPDYNYAPVKINEINTMLNAAPDSRAQLFENTIRKAESLYEQKNYQQAKTEYEKAAIIDTSAQMPKEKLDQISSVYTDPDDMGNFNLAIANGDKALASSDFDHALLFYEAALEIHPKARFINKRIAEAKSQQLAYNEKAEKSSPTIATADKVLSSEKTTSGTHTIEKTETGKPVDSKLQTDQKKYDDVLADAEKYLKSANYEAALAEFKSASAIKPSENYPKTKIAEITAITGKQKESDENYRKSIADADKQFNDNKFEDAISSYTKALGFKPTETYSQQKISEARAKLSLLKSKEAEYATAIASGDQFFSVSKYNEALSAYKQAISLKPSETYPVNKTAEINSILAKQKSDSDNYAQAIRTGEKSLATGNLNLALTSFQDAQKIKPAELYPVEQISEIKAQIAAQQTKDEKYTKALKTGDQLLAKEEYSAALTSYTEASELKKNEKYPLDQIAKINKIIADSRSVTDLYNVAVNEGDKLFDMKDYAAAISAYSKATTIKPAESYPGQRISEIKKIMEQTTLARSSEYSKALEVADKLYNTKIFDKAIEAYEAAAKFNPEDAYPSLQISKIRKYMSDHAILDLNSQALTISKGNEKKFAFSAIDPSLRKNNYILLKARSTSNTVPKVYLNYGKDNSKNGGIVLRNLDKTTISDFLISISIQDKWFREENNWISISVETGEIEITKVQIAAGE